MGGLHWSGYEWPGAVTASLVCRVSSNINIEMIFPLNQVAAEKMAQALAERSCELQLLRQHLLGKGLIGTQSAGTRPLKQDKQPIQVRIMHCVSLSVALGLRKELIATEGNRREKEHHRE